MIKDVIFLRADISLQKINKNIIYPDNMGIGIVFFGNSFFSASLSGKNVAQCIYATETPSSQHNIIRR